MSKIYDVIVLGAGPAGLAAGLYAGRSRLSVLIIEKGQDGGQIAITDEIENYPGQIVEGESGPSLIARMTEQAAKFGAERVSDTIKEVELNGDVKVLKSEKAFASIRFISCEEVSCAVYFPKRKQRDDAARAAFRKELDREDLDGLFIRDIVRGRILPDDPRLR